MVFCPWIPIVHARFGVQNDYANTSNTVLSIYRRHVLRFSPGINVSNIGYHNGLIITSSPCTTLFPSKYHLCKHSSSPVNRVKVLTPHKGQIFTQRGNEHIHWDPSCTLVLQHIHYTHLYICRIKIRHLRPRWSIHLISVCQKHYLQYTLLQYGSFTIGSIEIKSCQSIL